MIKVLIADDHSIVRSGLKSLLGMYPEMEILGEATNGQEAVEMATNLKPTLVLLDIGMPELNGLEALKRIQVASPDTKVLILSQYDLEEYLFVVLRNGALGYVLKETASDELVQAIRTVAEGKIYLSPTMTQALVTEFLSIDPASTKGKNNLTAREEEVLKLLAEGCTSRQIADKLYISVKTAQSHRYNIMEKLDLHNRAELVKYAIRKGIISEQD